VGEGEPVSEGVTVAVGVDGDGETPSSDEASGRRRTNSSANPATVAARIDQRVQGFMG
jgi:hypothetical protein